MTNDNDDFRYLPVCEEHGYLNDGQAELKQAMDSVENHKEDVHTIQDETPAYVVDLKEQDAYAYLPPAQSSAATTGTFTTADLGGLVTKRWARLRER